ncbi:ABC-type nitrate/sulfonate/bicarbonate transport system, permease component [uncultured Pleomorphomonas sp.]|uniref:ABC-type nitrate/sulfonate/bicarbonate transport system, permease component n=1 Tax=uncultured Pleomorphomonas sp. TaxID=442121 RepID=A0A212LEM2_9HYPH|nr:ABC transporter permease subunit [uncultured Pleomorphomonas sp.]SCM75928.1 ABC-type nitrate/sulfonate/bicarbonate transport system, permease component [uncultured Pleomorphomonas sp.]
MSSAALASVSHMVRRYWAVALVVAGWQIWVSAAGLSSIVLPGPLAVLKDFAGDPLSYAEPAGRTFAVALAGLLLGFALGGGLAVLSWSSRILNGLLTPLGLIFTSIPVVTLIPIIARMLGYDVRTVIAIVALICFFPAFVYVGAGLRALPPGSDDLFRVFGGSRRQRFLRLVLPSSIPNLMLAFRLTAPEAVLAAVVAEFLMGTDGLGYMFRKAAGEFDTERALATSLIATITSVACFGLALAAERRVLRRWT